MIKEAIFNIGDAVYKSVEQRSPEICVGVGIVSMVAATIFACKGTIKAKKAIEDAKDDLETIDRSEETGTTYDEDNNPVEYSHKESMKDRGIVIRNAMIDLTRAYGPAVILTATGIFCIVKGHNILAKRNLALAAAYEGISEAYKKYQDKVKDILGETTAKNLKLGLEEKEVEVDTGKKNKDGTPKKKKEKKLIYDPTQDFSVYSRIFDEGCDSWTGDPIYDKATLQGRQAYWNNVLKTRANHTVFLNEIYTDLGYEPTAAGQEVGWSLNHDCGDGYIEFGYDNTAYEPNRDFLEGYEPCCILDFNVDDKPVRDCLPKYGAFVSKTEVADVRKELNDGSIQA